jgi:hypothetical protein
MSGTARSVIWSPKTETVWPSQKLRKSGTLSRRRTARSVVPAAFASAGVGASPGVGASAADGVSDVIRDPLGNL